MLRDISELYAARLSSPAAAATATREKTPGSFGCAPPEPPPSPAKRLRPTEEDQVAPAAPAGFGAPGGAPTEGGGGARDDGACAREGKAAPQEEVRGKETQTPGSGREAGRPAGGGGDGGRNGGGGGGGGGGGNGDGGEEVFPSARPLRVFVSQGDVVYVDEVEAVAIRGGDEAAAAGDAAAQQCHACGEEGGEANGTAAGGEAGGKKAQESDAADARAAEDGEDPSPAFFDPLLNPGSSGGDNQEGEAWSTAVVLLVPLRLGLDELSAGYIPSELVPPRRYVCQAGVGGRPGGDVGGCQWSTVAAHGI